MRVGARTIAIALVWLAAGRSATAQRVSGTVHDSTNGAAVGGVVVWLTDKADNFLARSVGDSAGRFSVMRLSGATRLHVRRIGYRPRDIDLRVAPGDTTVEVQLPALPLTLGPVEATRRQVCPGDMGTPYALDLWEQARNGLLAAVVARDAGAPNVRILSYTRRFGTIRPTYSRLSVKARDFTADRSYVAARPAWAFVSDGYMREERGGTRTFYAPDEETLLDPTFADTHCLRVVPGTDAHAADVGIGFEPVKGRDTLVDVAGVLWLGRAVPELRSLEFHYTGLEPAARASGGEIDFRVMPNGAPMIERWNISAALLAVDEPVHPSLIRHRLPDRPDRKDVRLTGFEEFGGVVSYAEWPDGKRWNAPLPHVHGTVSYPTGQPAVGTDVWLDGMPDTVTTDSLGRFDITSPVAGIYTVRAGARALARIGFSLTASFARTDTVNDYTVRMYLSPLSSVLRERCADKPMPPGTGIMLGRVVDLEGTGVREAKIAARFTPPPGTDGKVMQISVVADEEGRFALCGGPLKDGIHLHAESGAGKSDADINWTSDLVAVTVIVRPGGD